MFVSYNWFLADYHKVSPLEKTRSKVVSYHFAVAQKYSVDPRGRHNILNGINAFCMMLKNGQLLGDEQGKILKICPAIFQHYV